MNAKDSDELIERVCKGGRILRGEAKPTGEFTFKSEDVLAIRKKLEKSQDEFALMIGVSVATLRNWEQGHRHLPDRPKLCSRSPPRIPKPSRWRSAASSKEASSRWRRQSVPA
jgi:putative transcriptional regulator